MEKKGFTLIELLAVLVLIIVITTIGTYSIFGTKKDISNELWESKRDYIKTQAKLFGEDNKNLLKGTCTIQVMNKSTNALETKSFTNAKEVSVQNLLDRNYLTTKDKDENGKKVIINDSIEDENSPNYYANNLKVCVYISNNIVYAELQG